MAYITFQPSDYFNTVLYTGNGSTQSITGVGFQPDWIWQKARNQTYDHRLFDAVRGTTKALYSNTSGSEGTESGVTAFDSDGFSLGSAAGSNGNTVTFASWNWRAGGGQGSSNTDGSINTTYTSVNTTSGFSISTYTGTGSAATVGHGLGAVPKMVLVKRTNTTGNWTMYHIGSGATKYLYLNQNAAEASASGIWNDTTPTSSVFSVGTDGEVNASGSTYVAYCFAEKKGFSKFGKYTGNGNANGPFIYTGFKPAFVITRRVTNNTGDWQLHDSKRTPTNVSDTILFPNGNTADSQASGYAMDMLSNGFKIRTDNNGKNNSSSDYIFLAFAEEPLVSSNNIPATAR